LLLRILLAESERRAARRTVPARARAFIALSVAVTGLGSGCNHLRRGRSDAHREGVASSKDTAARAASSRARPGDPPDAQPSGPTQEELNHAADDAENWLYVDHDYQGRRYTALDQINAGNVRDLVQVCYYSFPELVPAQTAPVVHAGVLYATTAHFTVAIDGATCKVIWQHEWQPKGYETFKTQRGAAIMGGKIVRGTADDYLIALDRTTGNLLWSKSVAPSDEGHFISMPPLIVDDLVLIGPAGSEWAAKGWVGAFRLSDGERVWKFNIVPDPGQPGAETWGPDPKVLATGGGNLWTPMSLDTDKGLVYVAGGNPAPDFYDADRPGDNVYTNSVIALDVHTGKLAWYYQALPHDTRDYDLTHVAPIFTFTANGQEHTVITVTGKDGLLRLLDRDSHQLLYSVPFTTRKNTDAPFGSGWMKVCPGILGGQEWSGSAYSPRLRALFVPAAEWCHKIRRDTHPPDPQPEKTKGAFFGGELKTDWAEASGVLTSFDAATGDVLWKYFAAKPMIGGATVTGGDLVFTGDASGDFLALDAKSGSVLYRGGIGYAVGGGVVSYLAEGRQYVAVVSGFVGIYNRYAPELRGGNPTITVFGLRK
jgi:alcohol dehydrogenase (cytochrome c)